MAISQKKTKPKKNEIPRGNIQMSHRENFFGGGKGNYPKHQNKWEKGGKKTIRRVGVLKKGGAGTGIKGSECLAPPRDRPQFLEIKK